MGEEGLKMVSGSLVACVHPAWSGDVQGGLRQILNSLLLRYNDELDGVVLAYLDLKVPSHVAKILQGMSPHFKVNLEARLLLFSPKEGMMLEGRVNKVEKDYIGVLVLGLFNAAIGASDIRREFRFVEESPLNGAWIIETDERHVIKLGSVIKFTVKSVQEKEELLDIYGSLEEDSTGLVDCFDKPRKRKKSEAKVDEKITRHSLSYEIQHSPKTKKHKKKAPLPL